MQSLLLETGEGGSGRLGRSWPIPSSFSYLFSCSIAPQTDYNTQNAQVIFKKVYRSSYYKNSLDLKMFYTKINLYLLSPFPYSVAYSKISIRKISELSHEKGIVDL